MKTSKKLQPPQHQKKQPGREYVMRPKPKFESGQISKKLKGKVAIITGGDSGIGRAVSVAFAKEGCDIVIAYLNENIDAKETKKQILEENRKCLLFAGDVGNEIFCKKIVQKTVAQLGRLDILVNNVAEQHPQESLEKISSKQLEKTFRTNVFSYFYMTKAALKYLTKEGVIINTSSVTAYRGSDHLVDYASTKGAIISFTRSLAKALVPQGIRVNAVAPGPIWTPLIPASFSAKHVAEFGFSVPMKRAGQPEEVAPSYVFLASDDSSYMTGQVLHPNGGEIVNG
jgi:NAD(P)-dependent dehydrogenase (short-subunit alcohol dehydrogenase family)